MSARRTSVVWYVFKNLAQVRTDLNASDWGLCAFDQDFWVGPNEEVDGEETLRAPYLDILEQRRTKYWQYRDGEVYVFIKKVHTPAQFEWFMKSEEELDAMRHYH